MNTTAPLEAAAAVETHVTRLAATHIVWMTRVALGIVFFWFGVLKFFPGASSAEEIAGRTIQTLTLGHMTPHLSMPILATWECLIGLGLLSGKFLRLTTALLFLQMPGTFLPFFFFPHEVWQHFPYSPSLVGQYIIKNLVLICAGILVLGTMRGGAVIADPVVAGRATRLQDVFKRFRRRFGKEPEGSAARRHQ